MKITIDPEAGFCFGVRRAIKMAEEELRRTGHLYCLGQIVHNEEEEKRLIQMGLEVIDTETYRQLKNTRVLVRAHGEPPETYTIAEQNNLTLIDGTCPIVLKLQEQIRKSSEIPEHESQQLVIFGKESHPEVRGLAGQAGSRAIIIEKESDIGKIDFTKPVCIYSQTTKSKNDFAHIIRKIEERLHDAQPLSDVQLKANDSICRHVSNRDEGLRLFARQHDVVIFVGGEHSSNGRRLYGVCKSANPNSWYIGNPAMINPQWLEGASSVGISGATSTPQWLMQNVADAVNKLSN